jgi:hypothetical protein
MTPNPRAIALKTLDAATYAVAVAAIAFLAGSVASFALGGGWVGVKFVLFFVGFGLFGYATFRLRPKKPHEQEGDRTAVDKDDETRFEAVLGRLPPLMWVHVTPSDRFSPAAKLLLGSVLVLATSFLMESVFGVAG